jgi:hypothetical protein
MDKLVEEIIKGLFTLPCNLTPNQILIIERVAERTEISFSTEAPQ